MYSPQLARKPSWVKLENGSRVQVYTYLPSRGSRIGCKVTSAQGMGHGGLVAGEQNLSRVKGVAE